VAKTGIVGDALMLAGLVNYACQLPSHYRQPLLARWDSKIK
jgi:hypothetical protein